MSAACFVVQSCLADADFVVFSNYCLIGTRPNADVFSFLFFRRSAAPNATPKQRLSKRLHHGTISQPPKYICQNRIRLGAQFLQKAFCSLPSGRVPGIGDFHPLERVPTGHTQRKPANADVYGLFQTPRVGLEPTTPRLTAVCSTCVAVTYRRIISYKI